MFRKMNSEEIPIDYIWSKEIMDYELGFIWSGQEYFLKDFSRTHGNPWIASGLFPDYIHGSCWHSPVYVELVDSDHVNVYERIEE